MISTPSRPFTMKLDECTLIQRWIDRNVADTCEIWAHNQRRYENKLKGILVWYIRKLEYCERIGERSVSLGPYYYKLISLGPLIMHWTSIHWLLDGISPDGRQRHPTQEEWRGPKNPGGTKICVIGMHARPNVFCCESFLPFIALEDHDRKGFRDCDSDHDRQQHRFRQGL